MVDIINYRGGKALVIDSLDLIRMDRDRLGFRRPLLQIVGACRPYVDYILLITSRDVAQLQVELIKCVFSMAQGSRRKYTGMNTVTCHRINLGTEYSTKELEEFLAQPSGLEEVIEKLKPPAEITVENREMTIKVLKEISEMYDLTGADTEGVLVKGKKEEEVFKEVK